MNTLPRTLDKEERIYRKKLIDALFTDSRSRSLSAYPLRAVFMPMDNEEQVYQADGLLDGADGDVTAAATGDRQAEAADDTAMPQAKMLISVPKHCFKRAVKRNRIKRLVREAYRKNKSLVARHPVAIAFVWMANFIPSAANVEKSVVNLLTRIGERLDANNPLSR